MNNKGDRGERVSVFPFLDTTVIHISCLANYIFILFSEHQPVPYPEKRSRVIRFLDLALE